MILDEVQTYLQAAIDETMAERAGSYRDVCVAIEAVLKDLMEKEAYVTGLRLEFYQDAITAEVLRLDAQCPEDLTFEGVWTILYAAVLPRHTPFGSDPLRVAALTIGYGVAPTVEYDLTHDMGLPLALNTPYDPQKIAAQARK